MALGMDVLIYIDIMLSKSNMMFIIVIRWLNLFFLYIEL